VTFLDVGQGDAAVVELPGGEAWLIDAGGLPSHGGGLDAAAAARLAERPGERAVLRYLDHRRIRRLRLVLLSHPHPDHFAGLRAVARAVPIDELWLAAPSREQPMSAEMHALLIDLAMRGTRVVAPPLGVARSVRGVELEVLGPRLAGSAAAVDPTASVNDNSLVARVRFAGRAVLFAGDLEEEGEQLALAADLAADVVKVPHHGSRTSSTAALVAAAGARWAVVSCGGGNRFGFPAPEVVARWEAAGATVLRTDLDGAVTARISPSGRLSVATYARR
jgi:competence protein ComEC